MSRKLFQGPLSPCSVVDGGSQREDKEETTANKNKNTNKVVKIVRNRMVKRLERRLETTAASSSANSCKAARALEQLLWRTAFDLNEYQDMETLDQRLRTILAVRLCNRIAKKKTYNRKQVLTNVLDHRYQETKSLVETIQRVKLEKVATMKGCNSNNGVCPYIPLKNEFKADGPFPKPVRDLFFYTPLIDAFEKTPSDKLDAIPWDTLRDDAQRKLNAYLEYNQSTTL